MMRIARTLLPGFAALAIAGCSSPHRKTLPQIESLSGDLKKRLAVVDFIDKTDYGKGRLGIAAADILEGEIQRTGKFTMVSHSGMDEVLNLQTLSQSGVIDPATVVKAGRMVGANAIINGSVSEFGIKKSGVSVPGIIGAKSLTARAVVDIRLIDGTTGVIIMSETAEGEATTTAAKLLNIGGEGTYDETLAGKALRQAIQTLVVKITSKLSEVPWEGFILGNDDSGIWITGGEDLGVRRGMRFDVTASPKQVTAPNGKTYSLPGDVKGGVEVTDVRADISRVKLLQGQAAKDNIVRQRR